MIISIELYGVPRLRAGISRVSVEAARLAEALDGLGRACPALVGPVVERGNVLPSFKVSINGDRFVSDPDTPLTEGDVLLILSADVGG